MLQLKPLSRISDDGRNDEGDRSTSAACFQQPDEVDLGVVKNAQHQMLSGVGAAGAVQPQEEERPDDEDGADHRGRETGEQRDGEALHRPGAELVEDGRRQRGRDVRVDDGAPGVTEAFVDRGAHGLAAIDLLADALEDQEVGVDRHADGEHEAGDARQRERRVEAGEHRERDQRRRTRGRAQRARRRSGSRPTMISDDERERRTRRRTAPADRVLTEAGADACARRRP